MQTHRQVCRHTDRCADTQTVADQIGLDAAVLPDGVEVFGGKGRVRLKPRPLALHLLHRVGGKLGEHGLSRLVLLDR